MIRKILLFLFLTTSLISAEKSIMVKVLLTKLADDALIEVKGRHVLYNPKNNEWIATKTKKKRARITTIDKGLYWGELFPDAFELRIVADEPKASILINGIQYKGTIEVYSIGGTINIVNELDAEDYLKSILSNQITQKYAREALDAIVITERTNLYYLIQKDSYASWQVEAEKVGYSGNVASKLGSVIETAVDRTRDMVLNYKKLPFAAMWGQDNAGRSVPYPAIYRKSAVVPRGVDNLPSIHNREKSRWKTQVQTKTLAEITKMPAIDEIELYKAKNSSKIYALRLIGGNETKDIDFFTLQRALGSGVLPSNDFTVTIKGKRAFFNGYGRGPGVGLCAESAEILAQRNESVEKILTYHFPGTTLINMRREIGNW